MTDLIARIEAGTAEQQRELLLQAFDVIYPKPAYQGPCNGDCPYCVSERMNLKFMRMLDAEAYESAALMLVPDDWAVDRWQIWPGEPSVLDLLETRQNGDQWERDGEMRKVEATAATPALAIAAAALRAKDTDRG